MDGPQNNKFPKNLGAISKFWAPERRQGKKMFHRTHASGVTCEPYCYLPLTRRCIRTEKNLFVFEGENCNNCVEIIMHHRTNCSHMGDQVPGICTSLF
jgi:hypothetical protein